MQNDHPCQPAEAEAAFKIARLMRREFGLTPTGAAARLGGDILRVTLEDAVSPLGRIVERVDGGVATLVGVYAILHDVNRARMHGLVSRILARPVRASALSLDVPSGDVTVTFQLAPVTGPEA